MIAVVTVALGLFAISSSEAAPIYDSGGFEAPRFTPGELSGQDIVFGGWARDGIGTATVQSATVRDGAQAVQLNRPASASGDTRYGVLKLVNPIPPLDTIRVSWDMNVTQTQGNGVTFGPFFGVEGYDAFTDIKLIGSLGVDSTTGDVLIQQTGTGAFVETTADVAFGQWNRFVLEMDYGTDTYTAYVNGVAVGSQPFVDDGVVAFTDAPLAALAAGGSPADLAAAGTAFYDNYTIEIVPEPSTVAIIGLASLAVLRRRRTA